MATFKYLTSGGAFKEFTATDSKSALSALSGFKDVAKGSGVQEVKTSTASTSKPPSALTTISSPTKAPKATTSPTLPTPTAPQVEESYFNSVTEQVKNSRSTLEKTYQDNLARIEKEKEKTQKEIDTLNDKQEALIETDIEPLLTPFREDLENKERERLYINKNFEANQVLTDELDSLLTQGNELIASRKAQPVAQSTLDKRVSKTLADVSARAGVIEAVMNARSGQIAEAYRMIDRSVESITADRKDQLNYFSTVLDFYENQKDEAGNKLLNLDKDQKEFIKAQIGLLEHDLETAEASALAVKKAMTDPDTALLYAQAGVTLNDTPEEIAVKIAETSYNREVQEMSNEMALDGYKYLAPGQTAPANSESVTITDSKGKSKTYYKKVDPKKTSTTTTKDPNRVTITPENKRDLAGAGFSSTDIADIENGVNDFGIEAVLENIDDPEKRQRVAEVYGAEDILDNIETLKEEVSGVKKKKWWEFWKN